MAPCFQTGEEIFGNTVTYIQTVINHMLDDTFFPLAPLVPLVILGDPAYPAFPWLMKPYAENMHATPAQKNFNRQRRARMVVENSFGRHKGRWWCLLKCLDVKVMQCI